jgi:hypothetical protein
MTDLDLNVFTNFSANRVCGSRAWAATAATGRPANSTGSMAERKRLLTLLQLFTPEMLALADEAVLRQPHSSIRV